MNVKIKEVNAGGRVPLFWLESYLFNLNKQHYWLFSLCFAKYILRSATRNHLAFCIFMIWEYPIEIPF